MQHFESSYSTHDGKKLFLQAWLPEKARASMLLVHGLGEHSGRYADFAGKLVEAEIAVFTFDGRGHGNSESKQPTAFYESAEDYLTDIEMLFGKAKNYLAGIPAFIYGHSMGGGLVAAFVLKRKPDAAGVILSSPAIKEADGTSKLLIAVSDLVSRYLPKLKALKLDITGISRVPEEVEKYKADPLIYQESIPARTGTELYRQMKYIQSHAAEFRLPLLILHGDADRLTNPKGSQLLFEQASSKDKTLEIFPGGYHELIRDLEAERYRTLILDWLEKRI
ncbi:lysophospholipase [Algoriphagus aestuariicola]|uniref:Lysophospholipase n=1 Tax=Algoriphagus aestuariicola TaxID=1852016 RepID=A0ABS3BQE0_9BACT|nr:alpha/beta hydrolase [Algoriphagus aestuariicola]MBN7801505.1 lysophospholipase [Algoriphagus aestuariicola]